MNLILQLNQTQRAISLKLFRNIKPHLCALHRFFSTLTFNYTKMLVDQQWTNSEATQRAANSLTLFHKYSNLGTMQCDPRATKIVWSDRRHHPSMRLGQHPIALMEIIWADSRAKNVAGSLPQVDLASPLSPTCISSNTFNQNSRSFFHYLM